MLAAGISDKKGLKSGVVAKVTDVYSAGTIEVEEVDTHEKRHAPLSQNTPICAFSA